MTVLMHPYLGAQATVCACACTCVRVCVRVRVHVLEKALVSLTQGQK